jgi:hypothetical protein
MYYGPYVITAGKSRQMVSIPPSTSLSTVAFCFSLSNKTCPINRVLWKQFFYQAKQGHKKDPIMN